jgi:hypothetical protein
MRPIRWAASHPSLGNTLLQVPADALHQTSWPGDESGHPILAAGTVAVSALIVLAGCLPGHFKPEGDLWPPDAQADGMLDEHREFRRVERNEPLPPPGFRGRALPARARR